MKEGTLKFLQSNDAIRVARDLESLLHVPRPSPEQTSARAALLDQLARLPRNAQQRVLVYLQTVAVGVLHRSAAAITGLRDSSGKLPSSFVPGGHRFEAFARAAALASGRTRP